MKKEIRFLLYANTLLWIFILYYTFDLLTLTIDNTFEDALLDIDLNPTKEQLGNSDKPQLIPKIIHQTYKTNDIPKQWIESQKKCKDLHPDYKYMLWTDEMSHEFIREEYPWFLETFENYKYPIERADAIRYFVLSHYGGVYIDLDDGCERRLDPLLKVPAFLRKTAPVGVSNDVMGSVPRHPFFLKLIKSLKHYDKSWFVPYMSIMGSTGPLYVSVIWKQYKRWGVPQNGVVRILQPADYKMHTYSFFSIAKGSSWHMDDAKFMKSLGNHILSCVVVGFVFAFFVLYLEYCIYCWLCSVSRFSGFSTFVNQLNNWFKCLNERLFTNKDNTSLYGMRNYDLREYTKKKRLRKDSNLPHHDLMMPDLEKNQRVSLKSSTGDFSRSRS
ncbi:mannosylinositol phosphorylceramide synthase catalytic subunit CSH1 NDAI_0C05350 [Naumovozyma dairenensis CBS 421]|uniref:inositol phosphorylceramide mannosyltransferase n=1 Tax=Naumovozyma dairenensis (strain ATCC 10597 / BCRC 20456 / CBS 421 / NBRC 0211 / NRRL Y-12639) TaxID=1071378 RepID=G0W8T3_NAUDC|nr:hypothetical protein NDAI_0C05350 [Naumovozyma dairenensis CBS 421]CCD24194.1 hypothetical protein NDAI_0C05350 [Naumovozyma dairenensis CBS 421]